MKSVNMHDAKTNLSSLVRELREGSESAIVICLSGQPVAKLVPISDVPRRQLGVDRGRITIGRDFDSVNADVTALFEGP